MKIVVYARVSTEEQISGASLDQQLDACRSWAKALGHTIVEEQIDAGISAKHIDNRPAMQRALVALRVGRANGILAWRLDRITRSIVDLLSLVDDANQRGWAICSVTEQIDTSTPMGRMMLSVLGIIAQWERESIAERVRAGMAHRRRQGDFVGGFRPAGTEIIIEGDRRRLVPGPDAAVVRKIWPMAMAGASLAEIASYLKEQNVKSNGRQGWVPERVRTLLRSPQAALAGLVDPADQRAAIATMSARQWPSVSVINHVDTV